MHILILNGSPKGEYSITLQTLLYLCGKFPEHTWETLHAGQQIRALEKDFTKAAEAVTRADLLLFSYPVYTFIAPSQLHRFLELLKGAGLDLTGKYTSQITTSKHFYDVTAHRYIEENCHDLGLRVIRGLSADMDDLLTEKGRGEAEDFFRYVLWAMERGYAEPAPEPIPAFSGRPVTVPETAEEEKPGDIVIVTDCGRDETQLAAMIGRFRAVMPRRTRVVNLREFPFQGGCLGCFRCAVSGKCIYKDSFDTFLRETIQTADSIVYAFTIKDHSMGALFKMYDDRQFCNGHRTVTIGMPVAYLISGNLSREENMRTIIEGRANVGSNILSGIATDEQDTDYSIDRMAESLAYSLEHKNTGPQNFLGVGGMKIFRDLIYQMRGFMRADHKFFKSHGQYDFPQKKWKQSLAMYLVGAMIANPKVHGKIGGQMTEGMLMPYKKVLEDMDK